MKYAKSQPIPLFFRVWDHRMNERNKREFVGKRSVRVKSDQFSTVHENASNSEYVTFLRFSQIQINAKKIEKGQRIPF